MALGLRSRAAINLKTAKMLGVKISTLARRWGDWI